MWPSQFIKVTFDVPGASTFGPGHHNMRLGPLFTLTFRGNFLILRLLSLPFRNLVPTRGRFTPRDALTLNEWELR